MSKTNGSKYPNVLKGHTYAEDVVKGKIVSCAPVYGACKRYLDDLKIPDSEYYFDQDDAEKYLRLVQKFHHINGTWKTPNIEYEPWQCFCMMNIMGWKRKDTKRRRFRIAHIEVPRGSGKSLLASQAVLYFLALDNPKGNEISCVATKKDQARIVLDAARAMARKNLEFLKKTGVKVLAHTITHPASNSIAKALSSDANGLDGLKDVLAVCDELHAMSREIFDLIYSGMSKRTDSLTLCITTAGFDKESVGFSQSEYAKKVATGQVKDEQMFAIVYTIDDNDDIYNEETWKKANPNYGVSVDPITFKAKALKTIETPSDLPGFKVKHLNIWLSEARSYYSMQHWNQCANEAISLDDFEGSDIIIGLDVASKIDLTTIGITLKKNGKTYLFEKSFIPKERVQEIRSSLYENCIGKGQLTATPGSALDYDLLFEEIVSLSKRFNLLEVLYDPWNAVELAQRLQKEGIEVTEFRMNTSNLSEPTKKLDVMIRTGTAVHSGSPLLAWAVSNVVCKEDAAGNVFPRKSHERLKIDPVIAILMSLARQLQLEGEEESPYGDRGLLYF